MTKRPPKPGLVHVPRGDRSDLATERSDFRFRDAALAVIAAKRSEHTKSAYSADLDRWLGFCDKHHADPALASLPLATAYRDFLLAEGLSAESIRRMLASLSSVYHTILRGRGVRTNPFHPDALAWPTASALPKARLVTDDQAKAMLEHAAVESSEYRAARDVAILRLLYDTGLRRMSVAAIRRDTYRGDGSIQAIVKGGKEAELVLPEESQVALDRWVVLAPRSPWMFPGRDGHMHPATINQIVRRHATAVGANHVHPHSFRAAFVTAGYDAGLPEHEVQASVHHSNPAITKRYDRHARGRMVAQQISAFRNKTKEGDKR